MIENPAALKNSAYFGFLKSLAGAEEIIININPKFINLKKENGLNPLPLYLNRIDTIATGISKQILYLNLYGHSSRNAETFPERFDKVIINPYLKIKLEERKKDFFYGFKPFNVLDRLKAFKASDSLKMRLITLFSSIKQNTYIDFWGDWCGPCMREMPNYPAFIKSFEDKPLQFIFFSAFTKEKSMNEIKTKYGIDAKFINLNNDEITILNKVFEFESYPSHFLMDLKGNVLGNGQSIRTENQIADAVTLILKKFQW